MSVSENTITSAPMARAVITASTGTMSLSHQCSFGWAGCGAGASGCSTFSAMTCSATRRRFRFRRAGHHQAELLPSGLFRWEDVHDPASIHDRDPVAQGEHLVELGGDDEHRDARVPLLHDLPVDVLDRSDIQAPGGLDVGSIEYIHRQIVKQRDAGIAVLIVSSELDEVLALGDRIAVMYRGRIVDILPAQDATREELGLMMAGATEAKAAAGG